jgi:SAM-dependent methyltransferase
VSTALHHFARIDRAVAEFARVLRDGGRVLVRTYVPDRTCVTFLDELPGRAKWTARFQTMEELTDVFAANGLALDHAGEVLEWSETFATSAQWVERMREADSVLTALDDDEIARGLAALRATPERLGRMEMTLAVFGSP